MRVQKDREQRSSTVTWYVTLATQVWGCFENLFYALLLWTVQAAGVGNATLYDVMWSWLCTFHHSREQPCRQQSMKTDQKVSDVESSLTLSKWNEGIEAEVHFI